MRQEPCRECDKKAYCKRQEMACRKFEEFVIYGRFSEKTMQIPTIEIYDRIFNDDEEMNQIWERKEFVK